MTDKAEFKFSHTFNVDGEDVAVEIKCVRMDCYPGGRVINYPEITEKLRRAMTSDESLTVGQRLHREVHEFVMSLYGQRG